MRYFVIEERVINEDIGEYTAYGIELRDGDYMVERVSDIATNRERIEELCELCNTLELSPIHLRDVVDDYLAK